MLNNYRLEHTECDFKREVEHSKTKSWLKSVCAFANGIGGMLVFGIDDETRTHNIISPKNGQKIPKITNLQYWKSSKRQCSWSLARSSLRLIS